MRENVALINQRQHQRRGRKFKFNRKFKRSPKPNLSRSPRPLSQRKPKPKTNRGPRTFPLKVLVPQLSWSSTPATADSIAAEFRASEFPKA